MLNIRYIICLVAIAVGFGACNKQAKITSRTYQYTFNRSYTGSFLNSQSISAIMTVASKGDQLEITTTLKGYNLSGPFNVHIHKKNPAGQYGYDGNPIIDLGMFNTGMYSQTTLSNQMSFDDFIHNFDGYFIVHDPADIQNDTTTLLIFSPISP